MIVKRLPGNFGMHFTANNLKYLANISGSFLEFLGNFQVGEGVYEYFRET